MSGMTQIELKHPYKPPQKPVQRDYRTLPSQVPQKSYTPFCDLLDPLTAI